METTGKSLPFSAELECSEELSNPLSAFHIQLNRCLYLGRCMDMSKKKKKQTQKVEEAIQNKWQEKTDGKAAIQRMKILKTY